MTGENAPTTVTTGFDRFGDWLFGKVKTVAKRVVAEAVPGATLIPAIRRQVEEDEQKRFNEWYEGLPDEKKARFHEVFTEPGLWAPGHREIIAFNEFQDMPGGPVDKIEKRSSAVLGLAAGTKMIKPAGLRPLTVSRRSSAESLSKALDSGYITLPSSGIHFRDEVLKVPSKGYGMRSELGAVTIFPREKYVVPGMSEDRVAAFIGDAYTPRTVDAFGGSTGPVTSWKMGYRKVRDLYGNADVYDMDMMKRASDSGNLVAVFDEALKKLLETRGNRLRYDTLKSFPTSYSVKSLRDPAARVADEVFGILSDAPSVTPMSVRTSEAGRMFTFHKNTAHYAADVAGRLQTVLRENDELLTDTQFDDIARTTRLFQAMGNGVATPRELLGPAGERVLSEAMSHALRVRNDSFNALRDGNLMYKPAQPGEFRADYVEALWKDLSDSELLRGNLHRSSFIGSLDGYDPVAARLALEHDPWVRYLESKLYERVPVEDYMNGVAIRDSNVPEERALNDKIRKTLDEYHIPHRMVHPEDIGSLLDAQEKLGVELTHMDTKGGEAVHAAEKSQDYTAHEESTAATQEQIQEAIEFLHMVLEIGAPQNEWEQSAVQRIIDRLEAGLKATGGTAEPPQDEDTGDAGQVRGDIGGGMTDDELAEQGLSVNENFGKSVEELGKIPVKGPAEEEDKWKAWREARERGNFTTHSQDGVDENGFKIGVEIPEEWKKMNTPQTQAPRAPQAPQAPQAQVGLQPPQLQPPQLQLPQYTKPLGGSATAQASGATGEQKGQNEQGIGNKRAQAKGIHKDGNNYVDANGRRIGFSDYSWYGLS